MATHSFTRTRDLFKINVKYDDGSHDFVRSRHFMKGIVRAIESFNDDPVDLIMQFVMSKPVSFQLVIKKQYEDEILYSVDVESLTEDECCNRLIEVQRDGDPVELSDEEREKLLED